MCYRVTSLNKVRTTNAKCDDEEEKEEEGEEEERNSRHDSRRNEKRISHRAEYSDRGRGKGKLPPHPNESPAI